MRYDFLPKIVRKTAKKPAFCSRKERFSNEFPKLEELL